VSVTVYSQPACQQCKMTYRVLDKHGVPYDVVDVSADEEAYAHVTNTLGYQKVPVVETETEHWGGFQPDKLDALAASHGTLV
jgi:glutaredoxin-like protein NrdH